VGGNLFHRWRAHNDQLTRGGPAALSPAARGGGFFVESDERQRVGGALEAFGNWNDSGSSVLETLASLRVRPSSSLSLSLGPQLSLNRPVAQYVTTVVDPLAVTTHGERHVFGRPRQTEVALVTRVNWILSPTISLQVYARPLISSGDYSELKEFARPGRFEFTRYGIDGGALGYDPVSSAYTVDPDGAGPAPPFAVSDPDFNFKSLRVNAVFRWEYRPGSTLYLVWTDGRTNDSFPGDFDLGRDVRALFGTPADDVLQVKASYRFGR
jgi:hypothetical protein